MPPLREFSPILRLQGFVPGGVLYMQPFQGEVLTNL